jgi:BRCA1-associated protein
MMQPAVSSQCDVCDVEDNLWICLICGAVGCGRYRGGHAAKHFQDTGMSLCMSTLLLLIGS